MFSLDAIFYSLFLIRPCCLDLRIIKWIIVEFLVNWELPLSLAVLAIPPLLRHMSLIICPPPLCPQAELPLHCCSVSGFRCCLPEPSPLLSYPPFSPAVSLPCQIFTSVDECFSSLSIKYLELSCLEFSQKAASLVCVCISTERLLPAVSGGPIRLQWGVFIMTFASDTHIPF